MSTQAQKVLIVDDHALVREGIAMVLRRGDGSRETVETGSLNGALDRLAKERFHLVLLDYHLPDASGEEALRRIASAAPDTPIVILTGDTQAARVRALLEAGARGYIPKSSTSDVMLAAVELVASGGTYVPMEALAADSGNDGGFGLTAKQRTVLGMLVDGHSNKEIASAIAASESTVRAHVTAIFRALGVKNRT